MSGHSSAGKKHWMTQPTGFLGWFLLFALLALALAVA